jgi:hypothetical protein
MIASSQSGRQLITRIVDEFPICFAGDVDHLILAQQDSQVVQHSHVDRMRAFAATKKQEYRT